MATLFAEIKKSNPYPRQKGGRFGFATGIKVDTDFDPFETLMSMVNDPQPTSNVVPEQPSSPVHREESGIDFETVPEGYHLDAPKLDKNIQKCKDMSELRSVLSGYGVELYPNADDLDFESTRRASDGIISVLNDVPEIQDSRNTQLFGIGEQASFQKNGVASFKSGNIDLNPDYFGSSSKLQEKCAMESERGWWVQNSSPESTGAHEAGHHMEYVLTKLNPDIPSYMKTQAMYKEHKEARDVVCSAIKNIDGGSGSHSSLQEEISGQSIISYSETMAEAFADCVANGEKAKPLSKEIRRVTVHRIQRFLGREGNDG